MVPSGPDTGWENGVARFPGRAPVERRLHRSFGATMTHDSSSGLSPGGVRRQAAAQVRSRINSQGYQKQARHQTAFCYPGYFTFLWRSSAGRQGCSCCSCNCLPQRRDNAADGSSRNVKYPGDRGSLCSCSIIAGNAGSNDPWYQHDASF